MNLFPKQRLTDIENKRWLPMGNWGGGSGSDKLGGWH